MNLYIVSIALLFLCFLTARGGNPTHFTGEDSIDCGSSGTSTALSGCEWLGDRQPKYTSSLQIEGSSSTASTVIRKFISVDPVPNETARVSPSNFSFEFLVRPCQKIILPNCHGNPYKGFIGKFLFTFEPDIFTQISNVSASLTTDAFGVNSSFEDFRLNVQKNGQNSSLLDFYFLINGIEMISMPASLSYFQGGDIGVQGVDRTCLQVHIDFMMIPNKISGQNIKQSSAPSTGDFDGIFPMWATQKLDKEKNSAWRIPVGVGFRYLMGLHFSGVGLKIVESDDVIFKGRINEMTVHRNIDIAKERNNCNIALYRDYMVMTRGNKKEGQRDSLIYLESYDELIYGRELAGFGKYNLRNPDNVLASPHPFPPAQDSPSFLLVLGHRNAVAIVAIIVIALVINIVHKSRGIWEASSTKEEIKPSTRAERICCRFSLAEIQIATQNFSDALLIGKGGFGRVYKGLIDKGHNIVAVKRLKPNSNQGSHEFLTEIETLSELRHVNLVSLIGYCNEHGEMILVYGYMACGTLADHLYKLPRESNNCCSLTWEQRLDICIGAGRGLDYLHTGHGVIHRDVKASNILLDEKFIAKVSDFGLAKPEDGSKLKSYISTKVKGTFGYLDPYYFNTHKLTRKSDTYALGVVLLEVLCGRPAVDSKVAENKRILSKWAQDNIRKGQVDQIVASCLRGEISPDSLKTFVGVVERCLCDEPKNRPTMSQIVLQLESALKQQENKQLVVLNETRGVSDDTHPCNDEIDRLVNTVKLTMASKDEQNLTPPVKELTRGKIVNAKLPSKRKDGRRATVHKPLRLWSWGGFWNRVKRSKKNALLSYEICEYLCEADIKLAKFDWDIIAAATNNFSSSHKVGQGGFGCVYKGVLPTGQIGAVKRLSPSSKQGLNEFKNEILLLPNLQHRNIVKLLGYCIHKDEHLLVYEYMENTSVDTFIEQCGQHFQWPVRFKIIMGIARGLIYLHQDSGLKVICRDLKPSNILLDTAMNPKISSLGLARPLLEHQSESDTTQICGAYGYMAPEYSGYGKFSNKSDVYSFGIITLEIISGMRAVRPPQDFLREWACKLWKEGKALDLIDESLGGEYPKEEALRCIKISLLCVQDQPHLRPTMPSVISMLEGYELLCGYQCNP